MHIAEADPKLQTTGWRHCSSSCCGIKVTVKGSDTIESEILVEDTIVVIQEQR